MATERPYRLLLVTFDLSGTVSGDARYDQADAALRFHSAMFRPVKQLRLLITRSTCKAVKSSIEQRTGRQATTFVVPINNIPAWRIYGTKKQREWRKFVRSVKIHGVEIKYLSSESEN